MSREYLVVVRQLLRRSPNEKRYWFDLDSEFLPFEEGTHELLDLAVSTPSGTRRLVLTAHVGPFEPIEDMPLAQDDVPS